MLASRLAPALLVLLVGSAAADDKSLTVHLVAEKAGAKWTEDKLEVSKVNVDRNGSKLPVTSAHHEKKSVEIVKMHGADVAEARYTYVEFGDTQKIASGAENKRAGAIAGKSYTLTAGSPIGVAASTGKATDEELALVRKAEKRFGQPDRMAKFIDGKTFPRDKLVVVPAAELEAMNSDDLKVTALALTYRGMDGADASFDVALKMEGDRKGSHTKLDLTGKLAMEVRTGKIVGMVAKGSLTATGAQSVDGTVEIVEKTTR